MVLVACRRAVFRPNATGRCDRHKFPEPYQWPVTGHLVLAPEGGTLHSYSLTNYKLTQQRKALRLEPLFDTRTSITCLPQPRKEALIEFLREALDQLGDGWFPFVTASSLVYLGFDFSAAGSLAPRIRIANGMHCPYAAFYILRRQLIFFGTCHNKLLVPRVGFEAIVYESRVGDVSTNRDFLALG